MKNPTVYIGVDAHKNFSYVSVMDNEGHLLREGKVNNFSKEFDEMFGNLPGNAEAAIEATSICASIVDRLQELGIKAKVAHPTKTRVIAEAQIKTDKTDSKALAQLLRLGYLPTSYIPEKEIRDLRELVRDRARLKNASKIFKFQIQHILLRRGIIVDGNLFTKEGKEFLRSLDIDTINERLEIIEEIGTHIKTVTERINEMARDDADAILLKTMPGVGYYGALLLKAEIADIGRFPSADKLCAYAGLIPRVHQSGEIHRSGRITKEGSSWIRWQMVQSANIAVRTNPRLNAFYEKIKAKKGHNKAIVATARKMLSYAYVMLKERVPYEELRADNIIGPNAC